MIEERGDTQAIRPDLEIRPRRLNDPKLADMRFSLKRKRAAPGPEDVTQMHYARRACHAEMEFVAIRENQRRTALSDLITRQHPGQDSSAIPKTITPELSARKWRAPRHHPVERNHRDRPMIIGRNFLVKSTPISQLVVTSGSLKKLRR